jgi:hypothetical protein
MTKPHFTFRCGQLIERWYGFEGRCGNPVKDPDARCYRHKGLDRDKPVKPDRRSLSEAQS